jgi:hypothetical protein
MTTTRDIKLIAQVAHETNRAFCQTIGDNSQPPWAEAPEWSKESSINSVKYHLDQIEKGEPSDPSLSHTTWFNERGLGARPVKDVENKIHPSLVPYDQLSPEEKVKDYLAAAVVKAFVEAGF